MLGIFDSGTSGLQLVAALKEALPGYPLLYLGDTAYAPFGSMSPGAIVDRCRRACRFLVDQGAKHLVLACHTSSTVAADCLSSELPATIIDMIRPISEAAVNLSPGGRIGIIGTRTAIESGTYQKTISQLDQTASVHSSACPLLVHLVEEQWQNKRETKMILRRYLRPLQDLQLDTLLPACSHFQGLHHLIQTRIGRRVNIIDPLAVMTAQITATLDDKTGSEPDQRERTPLRCFFTSPTPHAQAFKELSFPWTEEIIAI